jgi:invasion protein IalB
MVRSVAAGLWLILPLALGGGGYALAAPALPGGASSVQETYQDWRVTCAQREGANPTCAMSQTQANQKGQRVLAIELTTADSGKTIHGNLVLPFGLLLDAGAALQVDAGKRGAANRFSTCLPSGCIVPLTFEAATMTALRAGQKLIVHAHALDGQRDMNFPISLKGFAPALDRTIQLLSSK